MNSTAKSWPVAVAMLKWGEVRMHAKRRSSKASKSTIGAGF
jgi:hypothetical protein